ncbi:hypothetical protein [Mycolicibacterium komossense]|uniref:Uncharacterized protein n=1 Tax=Mycolicibacterium komossense TaxID=1779 RepID=A0ABT3CMM7_9MYCO|nr:hypothetical protein [Mycolicibacterium komossense]MCV7230695.1 hypothetical protein [Mycolicibacterium komossense]
MSDLTAIYSKLNRTVTSTKPEMRHDNGCRHPRRLERIDEWTEPDPDSRFEHCVTHTVCLGCDTTTGYIRVKRAIRRGVRR